MIKTKKMSGNVESAIKEALVKEYDNIMDNDNRGVRIQRIVNTLNSIEEFGVCNFAEICKFRK